VRIIFLFLLGSPLFVYYPSSILFCWPYDHLEWLLAWNDRFESPNLVWSIPLLSFPVYCGWNPERCNIHLVKLIFIFILILLNCKRPLYKTVRGFLARFQWVFESIWIISYRDCIWFVCSYYQGFCKLFILPSNRISERCSWIKLWRQKDSVLHTRIANMGQYNAQISDISMIFSFQYVKD
jgi:hypothetical protein